MHEVMQDRHDVRPWLTSIVIVMFPSDIGLRHRA